MGKVRQVNSCKIKHCQTIQQTRPYIQINDRKIFVITTKSPTINTSSDSYSKNVRNTIQPPEIEYTQTPQALVPIDAPLSIIRKHIPRQSDKDKIVRNIETPVIHSLELPIQAQDLIKTYQHSTHFVTFINT